MQSKSNLASERKRAGKIFSLLKKEYPNPKSALDHQTPFQLLIATILSAQCTDARVNIVTKELFKKYKKPEDYIDVSSEELEKDIYSTGFYKQKAKSIKECCKVLVGEYKGKVPADFEALTKLPGVGRKTASVVAGNSFGIPSIAVDTHVKMRLKELIPEKEWTNTSHWLIYHGRKICIARKPKCLQCVVGNFCPSFNPANR
jgi:endonuclease-3